MSDNLEILIIWHLRRVVLKTGCFALYQKKASLLTQADLRDIFKKAYRSVCINE
jgi:hypothetical protein